MTQLNEESKKPEEITIEQLNQWFAAFKEDIVENRQYLVDLDAAIGDADHGSNMARGTQAVLEKLLEQKPLNVSDWGKTVGMSLVQSVGGASGPLYGTFFLRFGMTAASAKSLDQESLAKALRAGIEGVANRGKSSVGDKTMLDVLFPALEALEAENAKGSSLKTALDAAVTAAQAGRDGTKDMVAKKGRASYLGSRSAGHIDPGAVSSEMLVRAMASIIE